MNTVEEGIIRILQCENVEGMPRFTIRPHNGHNFVLNISSSKFYHIPFYRTNEELNSFEPNLHTENSLLNLPSVYLAGVVNSYVISCFRLHLDIIQKVYVKKSDNYLFYSIFLLNDNTENRQVLFDILDEYEESDFSKKVKLNFKFLPVNFINSYNIGEHISI